MNFAVALAMFGWPPLAISLFALLPIRRAIIAALLIGWLFLPQASFEIAGFPDYSRMMAVNLPVFVGAVLFDKGRPLRFQGSVWDVPILVRCVCPLATSISNGLGAYDGTSCVVHQAIAWAIPYLLGRVYFSDKVSQRELVIGLFVAGLIYAPLCWWEMRMSPQLHHTVYGFSPSAFHMTMRLGGYRPQVFLVHGIALGLWMSSTALIGVWIWRNRILTQLWGIPVKWLAPLLLVTAVFCRSMYSLVLLGAGLGSFLLLKQARSWVGVLLFVIGPASYVALRATNVWHPSTVEPLIAMIDTDRMLSFRCRVDQEDLLGAKAWQRPLLGWGRWNRNRVSGVKATDAMWIIVFGQRGLVGLVSLGLTLTLPALLVWWVSRTCRASVFATSSAAALAVSLSMYAADKLMNGMPNPVYHLMAGSLVGYAVQFRGSMARAKPGPVSICPGRSCLEDDPSPQADGMFVNATPSDRG